MIRMRSRLQTPPRSGAAAVEFLFVMAFILIPVMFGIWEVGHLVQIQQIVANSAREGARLAAQARTINQTGLPTQIVGEITPASNTQNQPNVKAAVVQSLQGAGLTNLSWSDVTVNFTFLDTPAGSMAGATEPYQGVKNQRFSVAVSIPFEKVRWTSIGFLNPTTVSYTAEWQIMVDDPFTVNTTMPSY